MSKRFLLNARESVRRWILKVEVDERWKGWRRGIVRAIPVFFATLVTCSAIAVIPRRREAMLFAKTLCAKTARGAR